MNDFDKTNADACINVALRAITSPKDRQRLLGIAASIDPSLIVQRIRKLNGDIALLQRYVPAPDDSVQKADTLRVLYRNYRGEIAPRNIVPIKLWYGSSEHHPEPQWFLSALDLDKAAQRDFALRDFLSMNYKD